MKDADFFYNSADINCVVEIMGAVRLELYFY